MVILSPVSAWSGGGAMIWFYVWREIWWQKLGAALEVSCRSPGEAAALKSTAPGWSSAISRWQPAIAGGSAARELQQAAAASGTATAQPGKGDDSSFFVIKWPRW
jgi:hypothetical protein